MLQLPNVSPTANALLERALTEKLQRRRERGGSLGSLQPLALRLGLLQNSLRPRLREPQLLVFAADHGLAVEGLTAMQARTTAEWVRLLLMRRLPVASLARSHHVALAVVDCGLADELPAHEQLLVRKIAHGTRNARVTVAMTLAQAHAAIRAGMELVDSMRGNVLMCAGLGVGAHESAALLLARLAGLALSDLVSQPDAAASAQAPRHLVLMEKVLARYRPLEDPVEVLAAFGGFEVAMMAGAMVAAASRRHLLMVDGLSACAALLVAARMAPAVTDYCLFCRSQPLRSLDVVLAFFEATALLEMGLDSTDGTGAVLAWPMVTSAASLLSEIGEGEDPGPSGPGVLDAPEAVSA